MAWYYARVYVHVRPERIYVWPNGDAAAEPRLLVTHLEEVRSGHVEEPEAPHDAPRGGGPAWLPEVGALGAQPYATAVLSFVAPDGFPFSVRVPVRADRDAGLVRIDHDTTGAPLQPGLACLTAHHHSPDFEWQENFQVRGDLVRDGDGWGVRPSQARRRPQRAQGPDRVLPREPGQDAPLPQGRQARARQARPAGLTRPPAGRAPRAILSLWRTVPPCSPRSPRCCCARRPLSPASSSALRATTRSPAPRRQTSFTARPGTTRSTPARATTTSRAALAPTPCWAERVTTSPSVARATTASCSTRATTWLTRAPAPTISMAAPAATSSLPRPATTACSAAAATTRSSPASAPTGSTAGRAATTSAPTATA